MGAAAGGRQERAFPESQRFHPGTPDRCPLVVAIHVYAAVTFLIAVFVWLSKCASVWATSRWIGVEEHKIGLFYAYCRVSSQIGTVNNFCPS